MILSTFIGFSEDLENEFKEFTVKVDPCTYFDKGEVKSIVEGSATLDFRFNCMILDSISHYLKIYLPKYVVVFANSKLATGKLYLGVNDWGEITGIPYKGNLTCNAIEDLMKSLSLFLHSEAFDSSELVNLVKVNVRKVSVFPELTDTQSLSTIIKEYHERELKFTKEYEEYVIKHTLWVDEIMFYSMSLQGFVNDLTVRNKLVEYIESFDPASKLILRLKETHYIDLGDLSDINEKKKDPSELLYWLTKYKDLQVEGLRQNKPSRPIRTTNHNVYEQQLLYLTNLRSVLSTKLNYYVVIFELPTNLPKTKYRKLGSCEWIEQTRTLGIDGKPTST